MESYADTLQCEIMVLMNQYEIGSIGSPDWNGKTKFDFITSMFVMYIEKLMVFVGLCVYLFHLFIYEMRLPPCSNEIESYIVYCLGKYWDAAVNRNGRSVRILNKIVIDSPIHGGTWKETDYTVVYLNRN